MSKKKWMSGLLAATLAFTTVFSTGLTAKADDTQEETGKIVVYVAAEGTDDEGHTVDTGKIAVQVDAGTKGDVAVAQALQQAGYKESDYLIEDTGYGANLNKIGDIANAADWSYYWSLYMNGNFGSDSLGNITLKNNDKISYLYIPYAGTTAVQAKAYDDDQSMNPDSAKADQLLANAKAQQEILAEAVYNNVLGGGETVYGIENPDALYVAFSLIRAGYTAANDYYDKMYEKVAEQLKEIKEKGSVTVDEEEINLDTVGATTYSKANPEINRAKVVLFVTAMGKDAANISGCNLIEEMAQKAAYEESQGAYMLDCTMLLALDSGKYELPSGEDYITRSQLVNSVAASMDSMIETAIQWSSIDMAAMPLQCLYPYTLEDNLAAAESDSTFDAAATAKAFQAGKEYLENTQNNDGTWSGYGGEKNNVWTLAQIMTAMGQLRINPCSEEDGSDFIKNGVTVLDDAAAFVDVENKTVDETLLTYQPEQLLRGLNAVIRVMEGKASLYDVKGQDITPATEVPAASPSAAPTQKPSASPAAPTQKPSASPSAPAKTAAPATKAPVVKKVKKVTAAKTKVTVKKGKKTEITWNVTTAKNASIKKLVKVTVNKKAVKVVKTSVKKKKATVTQITTTVKGTKKGSAVVTLNVDGKKNKVKVIVK